MDDNRIVRFVVNENVADDKGVVSIKTTTADITFKIAKQSIVITNMFDDDDNDNINTDDNGVIDIPLPGIARGDILLKVVEFMKMYDADPLPEIEKPLPSSDLKEAINHADYFKYATDNWDHINIGSHIIMAANYLNHQPLLEFMCAVTGAQIKGKTPEEIGKILGVCPEDFAEEAAENARKKAAMEKAAAEKAAAGTVATIENVH